MNCAVGTPFQKNSKIEENYLKPETLVIVALTEVDLSGTYSVKSLFWELQLLEIVLRRTKDIWVGRSEEKFSDHVPGR